MASNNCWRRSTVVVDHFWRRSTACIDQLLSSIIFDIDQLVTSIIFGSDQLLASINCWSRSAFGVDQLLTSINCWRRSTAKVGVDQLQKLTSINRWRRSTATVGVDQLQLLASINCFCRSTVGVYELLASINCWRRSKRQRDVSKIRVWNWLLRPQKWLGGAKSVRKSPKMMTVSNKMVWQCKVCSKKSENDDCAPKNDYSKKLVHTYVIENVPNIWS
jgi:hypothetical protein